MAGKKGLRRQALIPMAPDKDDAFVAASQALIDEMSALIARNKQLLEE